MSTRLEIVREACEQFPKVPSLTLARMIYKKHRARFVSEGAAYDSVRRVRGNHGAQNRKYSKAHKELHRPNQKSGFVWTFPRSYAPSYLPFDIDEPRTLILSDLHIPFHDRKAIEAVVRYGRTRNPNVVLLNGDVCDFFSMSRFDKNPTESSVKLEIDSTRQFLGWLRQTFPKARIIYKLGNHDEWFDKYLFRKAPELYGVIGISLPHLTTGDIEGREKVECIEWLSDQQRITIGHLNVWHGHEFGKGSIAPPVNPARGLFMKTMDCGIMGHLHKSSMHEETSSSGRLVATWSTGCLCGLWPRYARVNKWNHGAAFVTRSRNRDFNVELIRVLNGRVL